MILFSQPQAARNLVGKKKSSDGQMQVIGLHQKPARVHAFLGGGGARAGRQRVATVAARVRGAIYAVASSQA